MAKSLYVHALGMIGGQPKAKPEEPARVYTGAMERYVAKVTPGRRQQEEFRVVHDGRGQIYAVEHDGVLLPFHDVKIDADHGRDYHRQYRGGFALQLVGLVGMRAKYRL